MTNNQTYPRTDIPGGADVAFRLRYGCRKHWSEKTLEEIDRHDIPRELAFRAQLDQELAEMHRRLADAYPEYAIEAAPLPVWAVLDQQAIDPASGLPRSHARWAGTDYALATEGNGRGSVEIEGHTYSIEVDPLIVIAALIGDKKIEVTAVPVAD